MPWDGDWTDPELEDLFHEEPALHRTAQLVHASRPETTPDVHFQRRLRAQLMQEAASRRVAPRTRRELRAPFWLRLRATHFAWGGVALGAALTAATVVALVNGSHVQDHQQTVLATSPVAAQHLVSPDNTIAVAFNQAMDHGAVESGLHIQPATQITTAWRGNTLVISPVHHLAGNTPYTVTIERAALVAASGARATAPVQITFGTAPTPPPVAGSSGPPALTPTALGPAQQGAPLLFAPDGGVVTVTQATAPASPQPSSTPSPSPSPSPNRSPSPGATPSPSQAASLPSLPALVPTPTPTASAALVELSARPGPQTVLGPEASAAAYSPTGSELAAATPNAAGGSDIVLSRADGANRSPLTHTSAPVVALGWTPAGRIVYATAQTVQSVDESGAVQTAGTPAGTVAALSPDGSQAVLAAGGGSAARLQSLADGAVRTLTGAGTGAPVAFSGDGSTVAWADSLSSQPRLLTETIARGAATAVSVLDSGATLTALALNQDGTQVAYTEAAAGGTPKVVVAELPTGAAIATGPAASAIAFSNPAGQLALAVPTSQGTQVQLAQLPGAGSNSAAAAVPAAATEALHAFLDAQVRGDTKALGALGLAGVPAGQLTPSGLTRAALVDAVAQPDGTIKALATLLIDPTAQRTTTLVADESLTLVPQGGTFAVGDLNVSQLHPQAAGPHVVGITTGDQQGRMTVAVTFDSDLAPHTVPAGITVQRPSGTSVPATVTYDANTRTATVTLSQAPGGALSVVVGTALRDVSGQAPAATFTAPIRAS